MGRALFAQALCNFQPVHCLHPVKMFGHEPGLVALDGAYAVPLEVQVAQRHNFLHCLLDVVLAKLGLAGCMGLRHRASVKGLGNRQQADFAAIAPSGLTGGSQAALNGL